MHLIWGCDCYWDNYQDMIAVDITDLKARPKLGDPVVLWGAGLPVEEVARIAQTIPYELLCGISQRVAVSVI